MSLLGQSKEENEKDGKHHTIGDGYFDVDVDNVDFFSSHNAVVFLGDLAFTGRLIGDFVGDVCQKSSDQDKGNCDLCYSVGGPKIVHFSNSFSKRTVINKKIIPSAIFANKMLQSKILSGAEIFGPMNGTAKSAVARFIDKAESALSQGFGSIKNNLAYFDMEGVVG